MNRELHIVVMPDGSLQPEWIFTNKHLNKSTVLFQDEVFNRFGSGPSWLLFLSFSDPTIPLSPSLSYWRTFTALFSNKISKTPDLEQWRQKITVALEPDELQSTFDSAPMMAGGEYLTIELLEEIWEELNRVFNRALQAYNGSVADFIKTCSPNVHLVGRVFFHLVEQKMGHSPFAFLATYSKGLDAQGQSRHLPLKVALTEYSEEQLLDLLSTVHKAARKSPLITEILGNGEIFHPLSWTAKEAHTFLTEVPIYETSGILCRIPNWWKGNTGHVRLNITVGTSQPSVLGMDAILDFNFQFLIGEESISEAEAKQLLDASEGLASIKNKWVVVDAEKLKEMIAVYEKNLSVMEKHGLTLREALRLQLNPGRLPGGCPEHIDIGVSRGQWMETALNRLTHPALIPEINPGNDFNAKLREYQEKGLNWLFHLHHYGFGACLADDMGLGKTVQLLAFLSVVRSQDHLPASLLLVPASLVANWVDEIHRFLPGLRYYVAHPRMQNSSEINPEDTQQLDRLDLVISTYTMCSHYEWINAYTWAYIILDEAQAIKNPGTGQTIRVKKLKAQNKIILTGTPIENRLSDLWSLFDFLNPGLLGNRKEFSEFSRRLNNNPDGYARLRKLVAPFILRRLKTDKKIISDLPGKVEMKTYAHLSKKQIVLYRQLTEEIRQKLVESDGIGRKGVILAALMKFKQICNHADHYLGSGEYEEKESGKFTRLREICGTIYEKRERVLVFTQFKEITEPLSRLLAGVFNREGLVLHGSVPVQKRRDLVQRFQGSDYVPYMVLSLKAGGVGLNLTRANHVIHFDRWWNPAVENQATDRAFRIGQEKNVLVHKFITQGTVEEKIDLMLTEKSRLSDEVIGGTGEAWITEMQNEELMELFRLTL
ncbi:MAG: DEAD/DEAH box helicase [Candidatus Omnitrophota bacterium]